jgi:hypothetical protein
MTLYVGCLRYAGQHRSTGQLFWKMDDTDRLVWSTVETFLRAERSGQCQWDAPPPLITGCFKVESDHRVHYNGFRS